MPARFYQRDAVDATEFGWSFYKSQLIHLATGGGKTFIASALVSAVVTSGGRALFIADQDELCSQPLRAIQRFSGIIPALEKGKDRAPLSAGVVVASAQSLSKPKRLERFPKDHFTHIIIDEAHRGTNRDKKICDYFSTAFVCGLTATPYRSGLADLSEWYENVAFTMPMLDLIESGFAPRMEVMTLPVEIDLATVSTGMTPDGKEYKLDELSTTIAPYLDAVASMVAEHAKGRKGIAFLPLIESSRAFAAILRSKGLRAAHVDGSSDDRDDIVEQMKAGRLDWICNAGVMSTGVDIPPLDCALVLKPMKSIAAYQQMIGRVMRPLEGLIDQFTEKDQSQERAAAIASSAKPDALIFDLLFQNGKLSTVSPSAMIASSAKEAMAMEAASRKEPLSAEDLLALKLRIQGEMEANLVAALEKSAQKQKSSNPLAADQLAAIIGEKRLIDYVPIEKWQMEPASAAQLELLAKWGVDPSSIKSKGQANVFISAMRFRRVSNLATIKQVRLMRSLAEGGFLADRNFAAVDFDHATGLITEGLNSRSRKAMTG